MKEPAEALTHPTRRSSHHATKYWPTKQVPGHNGNFIPSKLKTQNSFFLVHLAQLAVVLNEEALVFSNPTQVFFTQQQGSLDLQVNLRDEICLSLFLSPDLKVRFFPILGASWCCCFEGRSWHEWVSRWHNSNKWMELCLLGKLKTLNTTQEPLTRETTQYHSTPPYTNTAFFSLSSLPAIK